MSARAMDDAAATEFLETLVRIPSVSRSEAAVARFATHEMTALGFDAHIDEVGNAVGVVGSGPVTVALVGHIDTVPGNLPVKLEDGVLHGRGSVDAKGPFATFVAAASRAAARDSNVRVVVIGCVEEEAASSRGARFAAENYDAPDYLVVGEPSAWDGITLGYKGYLRAQLTLAADVGHTAHDRPTVPALACGVWERVRAMAEQFDIGRERAFDRLIPALIDLRCETDGARARGTVDLSLRLPPDLCPTAAEAWLTNLAPECDVTATGPIPAWSGARTSPVHRMLARAIKNHGGTPRYQLKTGTADLNLLAPAWGCPALAYGPGDAALDHTPQERVEIAEYLRSVSILAECIESCGKVAVPDDGVPTPS